MEKIQLLRFTKWNVSTGSDQAVFHCIQMVSVRRVHGPKNPAEMIYYVQQNRTPLLGTSAAKLLNTVDSQTMALTLGYFIQLQAEGQNYFLFLLYLVEF